MRDVRAMNCCTIALGAVLQLSASVRYVRHPVRHAVRYQTLAPQGCAACAASRVPVHPCARAHTHARMQAPAWPHMPHSRTVAPFHAAHDAARHAAHALARAHSLSSFVARKGKVVEVRS